MEPYVHSLVRAEANKQIGWCAPFELGEAAAHSIGFVIPVDANGELHELYMCETVQRLGGDEPITRSHPLVKSGGDAFQLSLDGESIWFVARPQDKNNQLLTYVGKLRHPDFDFPLVEIEPESQAMLDRLCQITGEFVIGCDPFLHYEGVERPVQSAALPGHRPE